MWKIWEKIIFGLAIIIVVGFVCILIIYGGISSYKEDTYCENIYPSRIEGYSTFDKTDGTISNVESGYIKCCRKYYELHELKTECQILPYVQ